MQKKPQIGPYFQKCKLLTPDECVSWCCACTQVCDLYSFQMCRQGQLFFFKHTFENVGYVAHLIQGGKIYAVIYTVAKWVKNATKTEWHPSFTLELKFHQFSKGRASSWLWVQGDPGPYHGLCPLASCTAFCAHRKAGWWVGGTVGAGMHIFYPT